MTSIPPRQRGFTLFEVLIALAVFVLAALGIGKAIAGTVDAAVAARNHARTRTVLESRLAYCQAVPPKPGSKERMTISAIPVEETLRPFEAQNSEGKSLSDLYELTIKANPENPAQSDQVSILIYRPNPATGGTP